MLRFTLALAVTIFTGHAIEPQARRWPPPELSSRAAFNASRLDRARATDAWRKVLEESLGDRPTEQQVREWASRVRSTEPHVRVEGRQRSYSYGHVTWELDSEHAIEFTRALAKDGSWDRLGPGTVRLASVSDLPPTIPDDIKEGVIALKWMTDRFQESTGESNMDPVRWIRTVNVLHSMGQERALRALEAYDSIVSTHRGSYEDLRVFWVTQILFQRLDGSSMPPPRLGGTDVPNEQLICHWPVFPVVVQDDVPFLLVSGYTLSGVAEPASARIEYCRASCQLRAAPLAPKASCHEALSRWWNRLPEGVKETNLWERVESQAIRGDESVVDAVQRGASVYWDEKARDFAAEPTP